MPLQTRPVNKRGLKQRESKSQKASGALTDLLLKLGPKVLENVLLPSSVKLGEFGARKVAEKLAGKTEKTGGSYRLAGGASSRKKKK